MMRSTQRDLSVTESMEYGGYGMPGMCLYRAILEVSMIARDQEEIRFDIKDLQKSPQKCVEIFKHTDSFPDAGGMPGMVSFPVFEKNKVEIGE